MSDLLGQVDVVFVVDTTGSMAPFIHEARKQVQGVLDKIEESGDLDLRAALVEYRDHPPQDSSFVVNTTGFGSTAELRDALETAHAAGGGDAPEAVLDGLLCAATLDWRENADKVVYLVGDAPAHGVGYPGDFFAVGCPCRATPNGVVEVLGAKGITVHVIAIASPVPGFEDFAKATHGSFVIVSPERIHEATEFTGVTMDATSSLVGASRAYMSASAAIGSADPERVAAHLGWDSRMATGTHAYMTRRGIDPSAPKRPEKKTLA